MVRVRARTVAGKARTLAGPKAQALAKARALGQDRTRAYRHYAQQWNKAGGIDDQHHFSSIGGGDIDADTLRAIDPLAQSPIQLSEKDLAVLHSMANKVKNPALELFYCWESAGSIESEPDFFNGYSDAQILDDLSVIEEGSPWRSAYEPSDDPCCDGTHLVVREGVTPDSSGAQLLQVFGKGEIPSPDTDMELAWDPDELVDWGESTDVSMVVKMYGMWKPPGTYEHMSIEAIEAMF